MRKKLLFEFPDSEMIEVKLGECILQASPVFGINGFTDDEGELDAE